MRAELLAAAAREPVETWMTWLHPTQALQIRRRRAGPGADPRRGRHREDRARAAPGQVPGRPRRPVLVTSFVSTLLPVYRSLFARLAPDLSDRVDFSSVHAVAMRILRTHSNTVGRRPRS